MENSQQEKNPKLLTKEILIDKLQKKDQELKEIQEKLDKEKEKNEKLEKKYKILEKMYMEHAKKFKKFVYSVSLPVENLDQVIEEELTKKILLDQSIEFDLELKRKSLSLKRSSDSFENRKSLGFWDSSSFSPKEESLHPSELRDNTVCLISSKNGGLNAEQKRISESDDPSPNDLGKLSNLTWEELVEQKQEEQNIPRYSDVDTKSIEIQNELLAKKLGSSHFLNQSVNLSTDIATKIRLGIELCLKSNVNIKDKQRVFKVLDNIIHKTFEFKDYSPEIFSSLRILSGTDEIEFRKSICEGLWKVIITPGKSGAILFFTGDRKYLLKSVSESEMSFFQSILTKYHQHFQKNTSSMICRILGMFSLKDSFLLNFIIMENIFPYPQKETYDLKGSSIGRDATEEEKKKNSFKDNDFLSRKTRLEMSRDFRLEFFNALKEDCNFLSSLEIMDYSLLLGISSVNEQDKFNNPKTKFTCFKSPEGKTKYYLGIIDILQKWNLKKKAEMGLKSVIHDKNGLSSVPPKEYSQRFVDFLFSNTIIPSRGSQKLE